MNTSTKGYRLLKKIKDEKFDIDELHNYNLSIQFGPRDFQLLTVNSKNNRCLLLEDFILESAKTYSELLENVKNLLDDHHVLKAGFWNSVKVSFKNNKFSLVPDELFSKDHLFDYVRLNAKVDPEKDDFFYYKHVQNEAVNAFGINKKLNNFFKSTYPNLKAGYIHQSSSIIEGILNQSKHYDKDMIFLYVDRFKLHIITTRNHKLFYYNQFPIKQFSDYIKYIMTVMKGLKYSQTKTPVVMWGYVGKQSHHYNEFSKYIKNLSFGHRPDFLKFAYMFDEIQDHHFFDLYSSYLCE